MKYHGPQNILKKSKLELFYYLRHPKRNQALWIFVAYHRFGHTDSVKSDRQL